MIAELRRVDLAFLLTVAALLATGIGMVFIASFVVAHNDFGDDTYFLVRHLIWLGIGLVALLVTARVDYHVWQRLAVPLYIISLVLLALVLVPGFGTASYGASRWFALGS